MLERIKHLFDAENVIFLLFMHTPAIHSAISKTYGNSINSSEYLSKFISITVSLPNANKAAPNREDQSNFLRYFLDTQYPNPLNGITDTEHQFRAALIEFAPYFNASFRDIERAMLFWIIVKTKVRGASSAIAYGLLLKVLDKNQFKELQNRTSESYEIEMKRLGIIDTNESYNIKTYRELFKFGTKPIPTSLNNQEMQSNNHFINSLSHFTRALSGLELEHIHIS
jgi:hypothetical protein